MRADHRLVAALGTESSYLTALDCTLHTAEKKHSNQKGNAASSSALASSEHL